MSLADSRELIVALNAVQTATRVCRNIQHAISADVLEKKDRSPVTVADFASQAIVCRALHAAFPNIPIVGEEDSAALQSPENRPLLDRLPRELQAVGITGSEAEICAWIDHGNGSPNAPRYWTLDPIDGTKGFLRGEQYAVSLALIEAGQIQLGVVACPNLFAGGATSDGTGVLLYAVRGGGCWQRLLESDEPPVRISVSQTAESSHARFCESVESGHSAHGDSARIAEILGIAAEPVRMDSQAKYAAVARGDADIYLRLPTRKDYAEKIWDHAGGVIAIEEAGGRVTDIDGKPLDWTHGRELKANRGVIVTNGRLHNAVLTAVQQVVTH